MVNQNNIDAMKSSGEVVCLTAELPELVTRLLNSSTNTYRPRFDKAENKLALMESLKTQSKPYLSQFIQWRTTGSTAIEVAAEISEWFKRQ